MSHQNFSANEAGLPAVFLGSELPGNPYEPPVPGVPQPRDPAHAEMASAGPQEPTPVAPESVEGLETVESTGDVPMQVHETGYAAKQRAATNARRLSAALFEADDIVD